MLTATFNGNPRATIISCYSPTNVSDETELVAFYDELSSLVRSIPKHNMLVIGGDMNAQIGKNGNNKYSLHNTSNRNGQHLTDFMIKNRLISLNKSYQKREGKLWTNTYANYSKAQIDYVFINTKWKNSAINCEAYSSFGGSSDHRIVTANIRLSHTNSVYQTLWLGPSQQQRYKRKICSRIEKQIRDTTREDGKRSPKWRIWGFRQCAPWGGSKVYSNKT